MAEDRAPSKVVREPRDDGLEIGVDVDEVIHAETTPFQKLLIGRTRKFGLALFLDGLLQSAETDEAYYHEAFVHPAIVARGATPRRVMIGGVGEGATLRELFKHEGVERVDCVDLDGAVIEAVRRHLGAWHEGGFDDPRVTLRIEDVQETFRNAEAQSYDMIMLDVTEPVEDGPAVDVFTTRFFRTVHRALADDGIMVLQSGEVDPAGLWGIRTVRSTLEDVFDWTQLVHVAIPSFHAIWGLMLAGKRSFDMDPPDLEARVARIGGTLRTYDAVRHRAWTTLPPLLAQGFAEPGRVVTGEGSDRLHAYETAG